MDRPVVVLLCRRLGSPRRHARQMGHGAENHGLSAALPDRAGARHASPRGVLRELGDLRVGTSIHPAPHGPPGPARYPRRHESSTPIPKTFERLNGRAPEKTTKTPRTPSPHRKHEGTKTQRHRNHRDTEAGEKCRLMLHGWRRSLPHHGRGRRDRRAPRASAGGKHGCDERSRSEQTGFPPVGGDRRSPTFPPSISAVGQHTGNNLLASLASWRFNSRGRPSCLRVFVFATSAMALCPSSVPLCLCGLTGVRYRSTLSTTGGNRPASASCGIA